MKAFSGVVSLLKLILEKRETTPKKGLIMEAFRIG